MCFDPSAESILSEVEGSGQANSARTETAILSVFHSFTLSPWFDRLTTLSRVEGSKGFRRKISLVCGM
jgi:hypothetical protein